MNIVCVCVQLASSLVIRRLGGDQRELDTRLVSTRQYMIVTNKDMYIYKYSLHELIVVAGQRFNTILLLVCSKF